MENRAFKALALSIVFTVVIRPPAAGGQEKSADPPKKVLVELYTSQGCNSCPPASDLLGRLTGLGSGLDRIVPINFHVDYFNEPWADPYSDASFSRRQRNYNDVQRRDDLYFTPLMMVDGRYPLLGSDRANALAALQQARKEPPGVVLDLNLNGAGTQKTLSVKIAVRSPAVAGRDLLIGVALTEDPVTTKVLSGENAGRTLVEHHVVRKFEHKFIKLEPTGSRTLAFPVKLGPGQDAARFRVTVFAQDRANGKVYQADAVPWDRAQALGPSAERTRDLGRLIARRKARRSASTLTTWLPGLDLLTAMTGSQAPPDGPPDPSASDAATNCSACGSLFIPSTMAPIIPRPGQVIPNPSAITC